MVLKHLIHFKERSPVRDGGLILQGSYGNPGRSSSQGNEFTNSRFFASIRV